MGVDTAHPKTHGVFGQDSTVSAIALPPLPTAASPAALPQWWPAVALQPAVLALAPPAFADTIVGSYVLGGVPPQLLASTSTAGTAQTDQNSDIAVGGNLAQSEYGVTGAGIKIGILSDSFNLHGGMAADIADGDLPANVQILKDGSSGNDEGRAMADLIHSVAPGASIAFYTATDGEADFATGIAALQAAGCNVIVDDVAYLDEPFFQDGGAVQQAVENAVAGGVSYFTAASNEGADYVQQNFAPMQLAPKGLPGGVVVQNFATAAAPQPWVDVTLAKGGQLELDMQWDQPFASIGTGGGSADSIGMALYNAAGALVAVTQSDLVGGNPVQVLTYVNTTSSSAFRLVVFANGGAALPGTFKIINYGNGSIADAAGTGSGTVIGHEMVAGANTVGAVAYSNTTAFGGDNAPEHFSSVGTGEFLLGADGAPLAAPQSTDKVDFLAPDGSVTSVFAPFFGTSAAAPVAAAVAALMLQAHPGLTPAQVTGMLEQSAEPAAGSVLATGAGLIWAPGAVQLALGSTNSNAATSGGLFG